MARHLDTEDVVERFRTEGAAEKFWLSRDAWYRSQGCRVVANELEYEKDGTYTVRTTIVAHEQEVR